MEGTGARRRWNWLLLLPFAGLLWVPLYARQTPELFGFPFFYWYQFVWVIVSAALTGLVYRLTSRGESAL
jgi:hypothetical protein